MLLMPTASPRPPPQEDGEEIGGRYDSLRYLALSRRLLVDSALSFERTGNGGSEEAGAKRTKRGFGRLVSAAVVEAGEAAMRMIPSWSLWAFRVLLMQQRLLEGRSATLLAGLQALEPRLQQVPRQLLPAGPLADRLAAAIQVELALMQHAFLYSDAAKTHIDRASVHCGAPA